VDVITDWDISRARVKGTVPYVYLEYISSAYFSDKRSKVLDLGCGLGVNLKTLLDLGYQSVTGLDSDPWACQQAKKLGVEFILWDAAKDTLPFDSDIIDVVICSNLIEHILDPTIMLKEIHRVLKRCGHLFIITPDFAKAWKTFYEDFTHVKPYTRKSLCDRLHANNFKVIKLTPFLAHRPLGMTRLWRVLPKLLFTGKDIFAVSQPIKKSGTS
jgi:SAM-dependent methyltransferase